MTEVDPYQVKPSQDYLKEKTVRFILECFREGTIDQLPPAPIVREDTQGELVAIDGHNLLAVSAFFGRKLKVHIAASKEDGLPESSEANVVRNRDLYDKFDSCIKERKACTEIGIDSFDDLLVKYKYIFEEPA